MSNELTVNLQIDASSECLNRLCDGLAAAVKPDGGYKAFTLDDPAPNAGCDQMVQLQWYIPQHGCDSLENTLDAIKGRLLAAVRDWWATALVPAAPAAPEVGELSPKEVEAQDAFTQMRDEVLNLSDGVEVNEVLGIIDNHTPEWV